MEKFSNKISIENNELNENQNIEDNISDEQFNCEYEGILGTVAGIVGTMQANEILKNILNIGQSLNNYILIIDLLNLNFRKAKVKKRKNCLCN